MWGVALRAGMADQRPLILIQMGNKRTMRRGLRRLAVNHKHWPQERWAEVISAYAANVARGHRIRQLLGDRTREWELNQELVQPEWHCRPA